MKTPPFGGVFLYVYIYVRMKRNLLYIFLFLAMAFCVVAQKDSTAKAKFSRFLFSSSAGRSIPFGDFTTYSKYDEYGNANFSLAGPPDKGIAYKLDFTYNILKFLGVTGSYCKTLNETPMLTQSQVYPAKNSGMGGGTSIKSFTYWAGNWQTNNYLLGLVLETGVDRLKIRLKLSGGIQRVKCPEVVIYGDAMDWLFSGPIAYYSYSNIQRGSVGKGFVINPGLELYIKIKGPYRIMLSGDLLNSYSNFKLRTIYSASGGKSNTTEYEKTGTKHVALFNFGGGICYLF